MVKLVMFAMEAMITENVPSTPGARSQELSFVDQQLYPISHGTPSRLRSVLYRKLYIFYDRDI